LPLPNGKEVVLRWIENALMALLVTLALGMVTVEVALRYFFPRYLTDYGLELTVYFTVWAIFIAGAPLIREGRHVRADILMHMLPPGAQRILDIVGLIVGLIFVSVLCYFGWLMVQNSIELGEKSESSLKMPLVIYYASLPVGMTLMIPPFLIRIYRLIFRYDPETMQVTDEHVARDK
jgi:TRAP-type C4-dicarboxylate transport system permease small subunit